MAIKVTNLKGTSDSKCSCGCWLDHWKKFSPNSVGKCREIKCTTNAEVGAHVQKENDNSWYIIPLCQVHNKSSSSISVIDSTMFVSANVQTTCGKK